MRYRKLFTYYRYSYLGNIIISPSKMKLVLEKILVTFANGYFAIGHFKELFVLFYNFIFRGESSKEKSERSTQSSCRANDSKNSTRTWMCKAYLDNWTNQGSANVPVRIFVLIRYYTKCYFGLWNNFSSGPKLFSRPKLTRFIFTVLLQYSDLQLFLLYIDLFNFTK